MIGRVLWVVIGLGAACGGNGNGKGELGEHCYPNGTCNVTLVCQAGVCAGEHRVEPPPRVIDAAVYVAPPDAPGSLIDGAVSDADTQGLSIPTIKRPPVDAGHRARDASSDLLCNPFETRAGCSVR